MTSEYTFVIRGGCLGRIRKGEPLEPLAAAALAFSNSPEKPFWQSEPHRKTYFDPARKYFFKIAEEGFAATCLKYFKYYRVLRRLGVLTPEVVACLKILRGGKKLSVIVTRQLEGCQQLDHYLRSAAPEPQKLLAMEMLARLALRVHRAGYYFSLDLRNIFIPERGAAEGEIYLLDLEHMKKAGFLFKHRIARNLKRFKRNLLAHTAGRTDYWNKFNETYNSHS